MYSCKWSGIVNSRPSTAVKDREYKFPPKYRFASPGIIAGGWRGNARVGKIARDCILRNACLDARPRVACRSSGEMERRWPSKLPPPYRLVAGAASHGAESGRDTARMHFGKGSPSGKSRVPPGMPHHPRGCEPVIARLGPTFDRYATRAWRACPLPLPFPWR